MNADCITPKRFPARPNRSILAVATLAATFFSLSFFFLTSLARAASEIQAAAPTGRSVYAVIVSQSPGPTLGQAWHGTTWEAVSNSGWAGDAVPLVEQGTTGLYLGDFPAAITGAGRYLVIVYNRQGAAPAAGDALLGSSALEWTGANLASVAANNADLGVLKARLPQAILFDGAGNVSAHVRLSDDKSGYSGVATNLTSLAAPTAAAVRQEIDANSTQLQAIRGQTDRLTFSGALVNGAAQNLPTDYQQRGQPVTLGTSDAANLAAAAGNTAASFWAYSSGPGRTLTVGGLTGADHAAIALDVQTGLTAQGLSSPAISTLIRQIAQIDDAEWGTITRNADGTYTVTRLDGGGARATVRQTYDATGRVLQSKIATGLN